MVYDVAVIGSGPAGMMAAGRAGELGARVLLIEKNRKLGIKLLMTGNGRCNLTNSIDSRGLVEKLGPNGKFLFSALSRYGMRETIGFFESRGVKTKTEAGGRVLPCSDSAQDVLAVLEKYLKESAVEIRKGAEVKKIVSQDCKIQEIILANGEVIMANNFIICTGGKSYPLSGSTGDAYKWLSRLGHEIVTPMPALVPVLLREGFFKELEGLGLKDVRISVMEGESKIASETGEVMFTADGMSGPAILNLSRAIARAGTEKALELHLELFPDLSFDGLDAQVRAGFDGAKNKSIANVLDKVLPRRLAGVVLFLAKIDHGRTINSITKQERRTLVGLIKGLTLKIRGLAGLERAMVTIGGVRLSEVDPKTMKSKIISNLYFAGEILDLDGPTGGYNLQICWSTGYVAGESASK